MAATTINSYSDDITTQRANPGSLLTPAMQGGRVRTCVFTVTLASQGTGEDIAVAVIPKGATLIYGALFASATLANSATLAVGLMGKDGTGYVDDRTTTIPSYVGGTATGPLTDSISCLKAAAAQGATRVEFLLTQALGLGYVAAKELYLTLTTGTGTVATETVQGYVEYVLD